MLDEYICFFVFVPGLPLQSRKSKDHSGTRDWGVEGRKDKKKEAGELAMRGGGL